MCGCVTQDWAPLASVFLDFFLSVFSNYRRFIRAPKPPGAGRAATRGSSARFDNESFVKSHRKNITKFLHEFERSQMYEVFFDERTNTDFRELEALADPFEMAVIAIHGPDLGALR